jgi:hypothetical protein
MGIQRLKPINISENITPFSYEYYIGDGSWYSPGSPVLCDINGKGYIDTCIIQMKISMSNQRYGVLIEVDGQTFYDVHMYPPQDTPRVFGFAIAEEWRHYYSSVDFTFFTATLGTGGVKKLTNPTFPYINKPGSGDLGNQVIHFTRPIKFENSFKVTINYTTSIRWGYSIKGGLIE